MEACAVEVVEQEEEGGGRLLKLTLWASSTRTTGPSRSSAGSRSPCAECCGVRCCPRVPAGWRGRDRLKCAKLPQPSTLWEHTDHCFPSVVPCPSVTTFFGPRATRAYRGQRRCRGTLWRKPPPRPLCKRCSDTSLPQALVPRRGKGEKLDDVAFGCRGTAGSPAATLLCGAPGSPCGGGPAVALCASVGVLLRHAAGKGAEGQAGGNGYGHL